eukprot:TRINITY_DN3260_c0_g1_i1.p1 TRINITY_DN3260_c0_g1~~TRINITY_DN3260_c0_g1_i1.p1  ORF type:complete len:461 (-),score=117.10 TRINITY_DN3260_c0_g1_i1:475-1827(-)
MVRVITQETFDDVVKENMEEFDMEYAEAVKEAKEQFESQGVNLNNIVISEKGVHEVVECLGKLKPENDQETKIEALKKIRECCKDDLAQRVLATNNGAYSFLLRLASESEDLPVRGEAIKCLSAVMDTNPDHLESQGISTIESSLKHNDLNVDTLDWLLVCCVRHEENRQNIVASGILQEIYNITENGTREHQLRVSRVWMALVQDDDIRVPFGKAHDHAREIVEKYDALKVLTKALTKFAQDEEILCLTLSALASLSVRNEYCQQVVDEGGLQFIHDILLNHRSRVELVTRCLVLIKVLAGNDTVKSEVAKGGGIPLILAAIEQHVMKGNTVEAGLKAITSVCLRQPENCNQVMEADGATLITSAMSKHPTNRKVLSAGAAAIRNIVSRNRTFCQSFIDLGAEETLNDALEKHGDKIGDTLKAALRDLGLKVELQERWTGGGVKPGLED